MECCVGDKKEKKIYTLTYFYADILQHSVKCVHLSLTMLFDSLAPVFAGNLRLRIAKAMCLNSAVGKQP